MDGVDTSTDLPGDPLMGYRVGTVQRSRRASPAETALRHAATARQGEAGDGKYGRRFDDSFRKEKGICELVAEIPKL
ncbi:unnamed protein product, partial [Musa acuminata var. zebrina]